MKADLKTMYGRSITGESYQYVQVEFEGEIYTLKIPAQQYGNSENPERKGRAERMLTAVVNALKEGPCP